MKSKSIIFVFLNLIRISNSVYGQETNRNWYAPVRNNLVKIIITEDSIHIGKINFDITSKEFSLDMSFKIEKKISNHFFVSEFIDSIKKYSIFSFKHENKSLYLNINSLNEKYNLLSETEKRIDTFAIDPLYVLFKDSISIVEIRKKKNMKSMTSKDFITYANKIIQIDSSISKLKKRQYRLAYLYRESTNKFVVSDCGFNSLVKGNKFDSIIYKFGDLVETKELFERMVKRTSN